jgi:Putative zinc-finger
MTICEVHSSGVIDLFFYDELDATERAWVEQHLRTCNDCRSALDELNVIRGALADRPDVAAPPGEDWARFMRRLEAALIAERGRLSASMKGRPPSRRSLVAYLAMAALLALVTSGVAYLARSRTVLETQKAATAKAPDARAPSRGGPAGAERSHDALAPVDRTDAALASFSEQHFERSKLVVLGLATRDPRDTSPADWAYERQLASSLLDDTRLFRLAAEQRGMTTLAGVMSDLELVLLQTSLTDDPDAATLERLQRLIRKRDLVTKMSVVNTSGL